MQTGIKSSNVDIFRRWPAQLSNYKNLNLSAFLQTWIYFLSSIFWRLACTHEFGLLRELLYGKQERKGPRVLSVYLLQLQCCQLASAGLIFWDTQHKSNMSLLKKKGTGGTLLDSRTLIIQEQDRDSRRTWRNFSLGSFWEEEEEELDCLSALCLKAVACCS